MLGQRDFENMWGIANDLELFEAELNIKGKTKLLDEVRLRL